MMTLGMLTFARVSISPESRAGAYESRLKMTTSGWRSTAFSTLNVPDCGLPKTGISVRLGNCSWYLR